MEFLFPVGRVLFALIFLIGAPRYFTAEVEHAASLSDPADIHIQQAMFAKNLSMIGAALLISPFGAGPISIDRRGKHGIAKPAGQEQERAARSVVS